MRAKRTATAILVGLAIVLSQATGATAEEAPPAPPTSDRQQDAPILNGDDPSRIPGQYIVVFKKSSSASARTEAREAARRQGAKIQVEYSAALLGFAGTVPPAALDGLRRNRSVDYIQADTVVRAADSQPSPPSWGLDRIDQRNLPLNATFNYSATGAGVKAYVIDTGIQLNHSAFGGRAINGYDAIDGGTADDCNGHGTHVAGSIGGITFGVAKAVTIVAVRVLNCQGSGTNSQVIAGIDWVTNNHMPGQPAVANMSLGGGANSTLDTAVTNSIADGVTYVVAAGNENTNACNRSPARAAAAVTVGATTSTDARASYSNYGTCLDLFAPGSSITSAWLNNGSNTISGTSMAAPHVAGVAALYLQGSPGTPPQAVRDAIVNTSTTGLVTNPGTGSPNRLVYSPLEGATPQPGPAPACAGSTVTGSLTGTGDADIHPNGTYYYSSVAGTHRACLTGPSNADFDLALYRWSGQTWVRVAVSQSLTSTEQISYSGTVGYYYWRVYSYTGAGTYSLTTSRP